MQHDFSSIGNVFPVQNEWSQNLNLEIVLGVWPYLSGWIGYKPSSQASVSFFVSHLVRKS